MPVEYALRRRDSGAHVVPSLDESQQAVLDHTGGPLLVLAGPGTGKTTTLVELVVDRVERRGLDPDDALVLTFSRKAAQELRARIARRLSGSAVVPVMTFHAYCYALVRAASPPDAFADPIRLLSAPEQEWRIAEVLLGATEMGRVTWPDELAPALRTRGFAREIADFLGRARSYGLTPRSLHQLADARAEPVWHSIADLWSEYDDVLSLAREADYAGLVDDARAILGAAELDGTIADRQPRLLVVDEFQDTDPAQVGLLQRLVGGSTDLVAVGDPDQSIYAFRGADVGGVWHFADRFGTSVRPVATLALRQTRRFGPQLLEASRAVIDRIGVHGSLSREEFTAFRRPQPAEDLPGRIDVRTYTDPRAEAEQIARTLRQAHLRDGVAYGEMAVLVRSGHEALAPFERALRAAGVPVEVAGDEIPLAEQSAVRSLLLGARVAVAIAAGRDLLPVEAEALLIGPLGHLDPSELRALARSLRRRDAELTGDVRDSREVLAEALARPADFSLLAPRGRLRDATARAERLGAVLQRAARQITDGAPAEQVLWTLWDGTAWPRRLSSAAESGDDSAHRDLDALVALFADAARTEERGAHTGLLPYLDALQAQQIPADTMSDHGTRGQAVRVMTAHRSKGLEWDLVVVAGVQDGRWPVSRATSTLLRAERLEPDGDGSPPTFGSLLAEERRLFYVAITRARRRLVVTAVKSLASDGEQPSRLFDELAGVVATDDEPRGRPRRALSPRGAVTHLRWLAERGSTATVRAEAARRLADIRDLVPAADRSAWWGLAETTQAQAPVRPDDEPVALSGSAVDGLTTCSLKWFLEREVRGEGPRSTAQGFGSAIHVLAAEVVDEVSVDPDELIRHLESVWHRLDFDTPWIAARERDEAASAIRRFVRWHLDRGDRRPVGAEVEFAVEVPVGDDVVRLRGFMDRVEVDRDGKVHIVDFKTGTSQSAKADLEQHAQLGIYQVAVGHGAVVEGDVSGGAELVQLRKELARDPGKPVVQRQAPPDPNAPFFAYDLLRRSRDAVRLERFPALVNDHCDRCVFRRLCPAQIDATVGDL